METTSYALVLTGEVLPGHAPEVAWPALAGYFRMPSDKLAGLLARAPLEIKQGDDLGKLQTLQAGIAAVGAEAEICAPDGRPGLFVLLDGAPRGPMPWVLVEERVERGIWPGSLNVAEVGSATWRPFADLVTPAPRQGAPEPVAGFDAAAQATPDHASGHAPTHAADRGHNLAGVAVAAGDDATPQPLPVGGAIHAGFWRRCAAMLIDGLLVGGAMMAVQAVFGLGVLGAFRGGAMRPGAIAGSAALLMLVAFGAQWLYFALFESSASQATPGKRAMGIKVVDHGGRRISFGRASGRYFGKILSGMILDIGYLMAGWTARKQALHDLLAGTLVVFRAVQPGQPLPELRPPMPWYGWLLNILLGVGLALGAIGLWTLMASLTNLAGSAMQGGTGF